MKLEALVSLYEILTACLEIGIPNPKLQAYEFKIS